MEDITRDYLQALGEDIAERRDDELRARFEELHPADIAEVFDRLEDEQVQYLWKLIDIEERETCSSSWRRTSERLCWPP